MCDQWHCRYDTCTMWNCIDLSFVAVSEWSPIHDDVIIWKHFPRYWPFGRGGIHRSPVNSPHKGQWCRALMCSLICALNKSWGWWFETPSHSLWRHCNVHHLSWVVGQNWWQTVHDFQSICHAWIIMNYCPVLVTSNRALDIQWLNNGGYHIDCYINTGFV